MSNVYIGSDERIDKVNEKITLIQKKDGLTFGTDAFLLAAFIKQQKYSTAVELGAGTGIISLLLAARDKFKFVDAIEIQKDFYDITCRNIALNDLDSKVKAHNLDIRELKQSYIGYEVDVVFSNPPYMLADSGKKNVSERKYIARHEVCGGIEDFCQAAYRVLKHGGKFYCVWRPDRLTSIMSSMRRNRLEPKIMVFVHSDKESEPSMVLISATKGGAEGMRILPPLFLNEGTSAEGGARVMSERAQNIYDTMSFGE